MRSPVHRVVIVAACGVLTTTLSCALMLGLDEFEDQFPAQDGVGGQGDPGGGGTGAGSLCAPGTLEHCYDGPAETEDVGVCRAGTHRCNAEGTAWSDCIGQRKPDVESCERSEDEDCDGRSCSQAIWSRVFRGPNVKAAGVDKEGNIFLAGTFVVPFAFPGGGPLVYAGGLDIFLAKFSADGQYLWGERFGDSLVQDVDSITVDRQGNAVLVGSFTGTVNFGGEDLVRVGSGGRDLYVAKFDPAGGHLWSRRFGGGSGSQVFNARVAADASATVVAGEFVRAVDLGAGSVDSAGERDVFVAKLAGDGSAVWSKTFGTPNLDSCGGLAVDGAGSIFLNGSFVGTMNLAGFSLVSAPDTSAMFLVKFDAPGAAAWAKSFDGGRGPSALAVDSLGNVVVFGRFYRAIHLGAGGDLVSANDEFFVAKRTAEGSHVWGFQLGDDDEPGSVTANVAIDATDNVVLGGTFYTAVDFGGGSLVGAGEVDTSDIFLARLDSRRAHRWSKHFGGHAAFVNVTALAVHASSGEIVIAGDFGPGIVDFGNGPLGDGGTFLARIAP